MPFRRSPTASDFHKQSVKRSSNARDGDWTGDGGVGSPPQGADSILTSMLALDSSMFVRLSIFR